jgi:hypothetical protein
MNDVSPKPEDLVPKMYLGDSVYAQFDGYHIILTTENGYVDDPRNRIALEPAVMKALKAYQEEINAAWKRKIAQISEEES